MENKNVDENKAKEFAAELNAIFQTTSAKSSNGIEDLFSQIINKMKDLNLIPKANLKKNQEKKQSKWCYFCCCCRD